MSRNRPRTSESRSLQRRKEAEEALVYPWRYKKSRECYVCHACNSVVVFKGGRGKCRCNVLPPQGPVYRANEAEPFKLRPIRTRLGKC